MIQLRMRHNALHHENDAALYCEANNAFRVPDYRYSIGKQW